MVAFMKPTEKSPKAWYATLGHGSSTNKKGHNYDHNIVKGSRFLKWKSPSNKGRNEYLSNFAHFVVVFLYDTSVHNYW